MTDSGPEKCGSTPRTMTTVLFGSGGDLEPAQSREEREMSMTEMPCVRVIRSWAEIEEIRGLWESWHQHPNSDIDFYRTATRSMPSVLRPHILLLYRGGTPRAMLIGRYENGRISLKFGYKSFLETKARLLSFVYRGFLGDTSAENAEVLVREILRSLGRREADAARLSNLPIDSPLYEIARKASGFLSRDHAPKVAGHRRMALPGNADEVYRALSSKTRQTLKWQAKKLVKELGQIRVGEFREPAELDQMMRDLEAVASGTYQRGLGVGFVNNADMRERLDMEARKGWLRAFVLYVADKPSAFWVGTVYQGTFFSNFLGYSSQHAKYSPGMFLVMKAIEGLAASQDGQRVHTVDFGLGDARYKATLADKEWQESTMYMFAPTPRGVGVNLFLRTPAAALNHIAEGALKKTGFLPKIKKLWRTRVRES